MSKIVIVRFKNGNYGIRKGRFKWAYKFLHCTKDGFMWRPIVPGINIDAWRQAREWYDKESCEESLIKYYNQTVADKGEEVK